MQTWSLNPYTVRFLFSNIGVIHPLLDGVKIEIAKKDGHALLGKNVADVR